MYQKEYQSTQVERKLKMLNSKQKMALKAIGNTTKNKYTLGKNEITNTFLEMIDNALEAKELIKVNVLKSAAVPVREIALDISTKTHSEIVQIIGHTILLYRKSKKVTVVHF